MLKHASDLVKLLVKTTARLQEMYITDETDFCGASSPYVREKIHALEMELVSMRHRIKELKK